MLFIRIFFEWITTITILWLEKNQRKELTKYIFAQICDLGLGFFKIIFKLVYSYNHSFKGGLLLLSRVRSIIEPYLRFEFENSTTNDSLVKWYSQLSLLYFKITI